MKDAYVYKSTTVAKYIVAMANEKKIRMNVTKLQKLLYITYGTYMVYMEKILTDEKPEAWPYGPVFPSTRLYFLNEEFSTVSLDDSELKSIKNDSKLNTIVHAVLDHFGKWSATNLTEWSHKSGSPWDYTKSQFGFHWGVEINDYIIKDYFATIVA